MTNLASTAGLSKAAFKRARFFQLKTLPQQNLLKQRCKTKADEEKCNEATADDLLRKEYAEAQALKVISSLRDDQSRIDHVLCSHDDFKLIRGIVMDADNKIPNTAYRTLILDLDKKAYPIQETHCHSRPQLPFNFHKESLPNKNGKPFWEIQKQHKEEWSKLMASAIDPTMIIDEKNPDLSTRDRHTAWFKSYCSLLSRTIDEHNAKDAVDAHIKTKTQKKNCGHAFWNRAYNKTAKTMHFMKNTMDLLATRKHKAKIQPLLQKIITEHPDQAPVLTKPTTPTEALTLYDRIRALRKSVSIPLQKRNRELAYAISKKQRELTQTIQLEGKTSSAS